MSQKKLSSFFKPLQKTPLKDIQRTLESGCKRKAEMLGSDGESESPKSKNPKNEDSTTSETNEPASHVNVERKFADENAPVVCDENKPLEPFQSTLKFKVPNDDIRAEIADMASRLPVLDTRMGPTWFRALKPEFKKPYFEKLSKFVIEERKRAEIFPPPDKVWSWTKECSLENIKVVILGQDPYHNPGQAHGLCFSVQIPVKPPPSLLNMYKELANDIEGFVPPKHGYLVGWARQGVLLLNACLTVRKNMPNSHKDQGWENLTTAVIKYLNDHKTGIVFLLWGSYAQKKADFVDKKKHCVLKTVHPSPLSASRGWFGNKHFSKCNEYLVSIGKRPIDWTRLPEK
uniref:Uracil-DNA glycosylase n=1 Tax=Lygus hesperus TaxID=30085 RepID=A0A0A9WK06_LYGHE